MEYLYILLIFFIMTLFATTKRTGKYRISKVKSFNTDVHYEVEWEMASVIGGNTWHPEMHDRRPMKFPTEARALSFVNHGVEQREIIKEGRVDNV